ncbi:MAG: DUF6020 family protein [Clostridium sp.]|nr:DUF6020 family protein [Clostridium sp.]
MKRIVNSKTFYNTTIGLFVVLVLWALGDMAQIREKGRLFGYNITAVAIALITAYLLHRVAARRKILDARQCCVSLIGGFLVSATYVLGSYLYYKNDLGSGFFDYLRIFILIMGLCPLTVPLMSELFWLIDQKSVSSISFDINPEIKLDAKHKHKKAGIYRLLRDWAIIFGCHFTVFLAFWPSNFIFDAKYQMREVINNSFKVHHPLMHTWLMGYFYNLGEDIGNISLGFSGYTILQMLIVTASFAYALHYLRKRNVPTWIRVLTLLFFALFPLNPAFSITATKDVLFAAFFLFFTVYIFRYLDQERFGPKEWIPFFIFGILTLQFRKNAVYAVLFMMVLYAFRRQAWRQKWVFLVFLLTVVMGSRITDHQLIKALNADDWGSRREMLSVPLQQMARVASYHRNDLTDDWYDEITMYMTPYGIGEYNPYLSDPVKNTANEFLLRDNTLNFFKLWAKIGLHFPGEYIESFYTNTMGYWYPGEPSYIIADGVNGVSLHHTLIEEGEKGEIVKRDYFKPMNIIYSYLFLVGKGQEVPVLGFLCRPVLYVWILVIYSLVCFYRKDRKSLLYALLPIGYVLSCFMGPTASLRYVYCIVVVAPLFLIRMMVRRRETRKS